MRLGEDALAQNNVRARPEDRSARFVRNNNYGMFLCQRKREKEAMKYFWPR